MVGTQQQMSLPLVSSSVETSTCPVGRPAFQALFFSRNHGLAPPCAQGHSHLSDNLARAIPAVTIDVAISSVETALMAVNLCTMSTGSYLEVLCLRIIRVFNQCCLLDWFQM